MRHDDKLRDEKLQCDTYREAAKISVFSSVKIDKYEYLTGEEILPPDQSKIIEQAKFKYSLLGKALEKQTKTIVHTTEKQMTSIENRVEKQILNTEQNSIRELF